MKEVYLEIGKIVAIYQQRAKVRSDTKRMGAFVREAEKNVRMFGIYDDCGPDYIQEYDNIRYTFDEMIKQKISMDKYCKKLRSEFIDKYPEYETELMDIIKNER